MRGSYVRGKQSEMNRKLGAKNRKKENSGIESMQEKSIFKQFSVYSTYPSFVKVIKAISSNILFIYPLAIILFPHKYDYQKYLKKVGFNNFFFFFFFFEKIN